MKAFIKRISAILPLSAVIILAGIAGLPLLHPGLPPSHDGEYHVIRFYEFYKVLQEGTWYPRWAPDLNNTYGVPLFNYVYPLPNYVAAFLHSLGISFIDALKLNMFIATIIGAIFFYLWTKQYWGRAGASVSAIFYTYAPYHFVDIYIRGSVGEVWALALFPAFLWATSMLFVTKKSKYMIIAGIFLGLLIFSHNILALLFFMFALSYLGYLLLIHNADRKILVQRTVVLIAIGLSLSAIFWLPAIVETTYVTGLQIFAIDANFPEIYQLLIPSWGTGFSGGGLQDQMSFQIGLANLVAVFCSVIVFITRKGQKNHTSIAFLFFLWFMFSVFFMHRSSTVLWEALPFFHYFQFPWRMLSVTIVSASFLAGYTIAVVKSDKIKKLATIVSITFVLLTTVSYTKPAYYHDRTDSHYISRPNFIHGTNSPGNSFSTIWFNQTLEKPDTRLVSSAKTTRIKTVFAKSTEYTFYVQNETASTYIVNTAYFPGWKVYAGGILIDSQPTKDGRIQFSLPKGEHTVEVRFRDTMVRQFAQAWFFMTLVFLSLYGLRQKYKKHP